MICVQIINMSTTSILFSPIPIEELESRLEAKLQQIVQSELSRIEDNKALDRLLSPEETRKIFTPAISKVTLHHWAEQGKLKKHRIGSRVYYKYSEVMDSLIHLKKYGR